MPVPVARPVNLLHDERAQVRFSEQERLAIWADVKPGMQIPQCTCPTQPA